MGHSGAHRNLSGGFLQVAKPRTQQRRNGLIEPGMAMPDIALRDPSGQERRPVRPARKSGPRGLLGQLVRTLPPGEPQRGSRLQRIPGPRLRGLQHFARPRRQMATRHRTRRLDVGQSHQRPERDGAALSPNFTASAAFPTPSSSTGKATVVATHLRGARLEQNSRSSSDSPCLWPFISLLTSTSAPPNPAASRERERVFLKWLDDVGSQGDGLPSPRRGPHRLLVRVAPCGAQGGRASVGAHR